jgi:NitT/TauT family transport system ATP-binding protein
LGPKKNFFVLENISKSYGENHVLTEITLYVNEGEFVCILGNTGCGKSTLLKIMGGIELPDEGKVIFQGTPRERKNTPASQSCFGMVFQKDQLMDWRTVYENVRFPLEIFGVNGADGPSRVEEILDVVGLKKFGNLYPRELSGGMRQRAAIARSLVHDPNVLFLDQPFDAVDAISRKALSFELLDIWRKTSKTIVMITNSIDEALLLGGRVVVMSDAPSSIAGTFEVGLLHKEKTGDFRESQAFWSLRRKIRQTLECRQLCEEAV